MIMIMMMMMILKRLGMKVCGSGGLNSYILNHKIERRKEMSLIFWLLFLTEEKKPRSKVSFEQFGPTGGAELWRIVHARPAKHTKCLS